MIGPILSGKGTWWEQRGPGRIQNHGAKSSPAAGGNGGDENGHDKSVGGHFSWTPGFNLREYRSIKAQWIDTIYQIM